ncbi:MAG TPA: fibronectin type III domain-containing protein [Candidatus Thermoplasmatota archaeon]|jgi:hypothetical protein|nr:fibronectin type III domain-containing protein [Candidatus Thermoplasmatota archaeon]
MLLATTVLTAPPAGASAFGCHDFEGGDADFARENDQPFSAAVIEQGHLRVDSDRRDASDEHMRWALPEPLTEFRGFDVTASFSIADTGRWQSAYPLVLARADVLDIRPGFDRPFADVLTVMWGTREAYEDADLWIWYTDSAGIPRIDVGPTRAAPGAYDVAVGYDDGAIGVTVAHAGGGVVAQAAYTVGSHADDGFRFDKVGAASAGYEDSAEPALRIWVDDLCVALGAPAPPSPPRALHAEPVVDQGSVALGWQTPVTDGGAEILGYRVYRAGDPDSAPALVGEAPADATAFVDPARPLGTANFYRVAAFNAVGEGSPSNAACAAGTGAGVPSLPFATCLDSGVTSVEASELGFAQACDPLRLVCIGPFSTLLPERAAATVTRTIVYLAVAPEVHDEPVGPIQLGTPIPIVVCPDTCGPVPTPDGTVDLRGIITVEATAAGKHVLHVFTLGLPTPL